MNRIWSQGNSLHSDKKYAFVTNPIINIPLKNVSKRARLQFEAIRLLHFKLKPSNKIQIS